MFESIILRKNQPDISYPDIGLLAECMLFYNNVHVIADISMIQSLVQKLGLDLFENLISEGYIQFSFSVRGTGTWTKAGGTQDEYHQYETYAITKHRNKEIDFEANFIDMLERGSGKRGKSRRVGRRMLQKIEMIDYQNILPQNESIPNTAKNDLFDKNFLKNAIKISLKHLVPNYKFPSDWYFNIIPFKAGFKVDTNINFNYLNKSLSSVYFNKPDSKLTRAYLLDTFLKTNEDLFLAAHFKKEIVTLPITSELIQYKCEEIINKTNNSVMHKELFHNQVISDVKNVRDVINCGEKSLKDILPIVDKSKNFKSWVLGKTGEDLIKDYCQELSSQSWLESLPGKLVKFSFFTGAGLLISPAAGVAMGLFESFILERLIKGWKPVQYVSEIQKFLK